MGSLPILTHEYVLVNPLTEQIDTTPIGEFIIKKMKSFGNQAAMVSSITDETITYNDVIRDAVKVAEGLKRRGVKHGDVIGICCENRWEYAPMILGVLSCGATCSMLNPIYNKDELIHILSIAKPVKIFVSPFFAEKIQETQSKMSFVKEIIVLDDFKSDERLTSYKDLISNNATLENYDFPKLNISEAVAFLFCSSGTTGLPKCVELTHQNLQFSINFLGKFINFGFENERIVALGLIPFFHGYGASILLLSLLMQIFLVVMPRFEEENFLKSIEKYKITHLILVPPLLVFLSKHPLVSKYNLSSVRKVVCGAAPLSKATQAMAQKRLKLDSEIQQGYGMTELSICISAFQNFPPKTGSAGIIAPGVECKVVDLETGKALPSYKEGELCFRGPYIMKGYKDNPEATRACFDNDGWFHTGDIGYYDNEGYLFIIDRLKELIKYKGFQVAPAELETILINHPMIKDAGVIGIPDENAGELPFAFVVKQPGANITEQDVIKYVASKVSPQKRLHGGVKFMEEIPKNPSGKILRRQLRAMANKSKL